MNKRNVVQETVLSYQDISLPIDHRVSPSLKLVMFVNYKNTTISESHTYAVESCQNHKVSAQWNAAKVLPGSPVTFTVEAQQDSLCAISATDKSVELLGNKNKVTSETLENLQSLIGNRKNFNRYDYWEYQKCKEAYDFIKKFERTGIHISSDLSIFNC